MEKKEFYIGYLTKEYIEFNRRYFAEYCSENERPHFMLSYGDVGGSDSGSGGDPHELDSKSYYAIRDSFSFTDLALGILYYLKNPYSLEHTWQICLSDDASEKLKKNEKKLLEEILLMHNDLITLRRTIDYKEKIIDNL